MYTNEFENWYIWDWRIKLTCPELDGGENGVVDDELFGGVGETSLFNLDDVGARTEGGRGLKLTKRVGLEGAGGDATIFDYLDDGVFD